MYKLLHSISISDDSQQLEANQVFIICLYNAIQNSDQRKKEWTTDICNNLDKSHKLMLTEYRHEYILYDSIHVTFKIDKIISGDWNQNGD